MSNYIEKIKDKETLDELTWDDIINSLETEELEEKDVTALSYLLMGESIPNAAARADISPATLRRHLQENKLMQRALSEKKKLVVAFVFNQFQKRMTQALDISQNFLELDVTDDKFVISKTKSGIFNKQVSHAQWVMEKFMDMINNNPLDKLNIQHTGEGSVNILLNVENSSPLDYLGSKISTGEIPEEIYSDEPLLDIKGKPFFGVLGDWSYNQEGSIVCHICGEELSTKQAFINHLKSHSIVLDIYENVFNVLWSDLV